MSNQVKKKILHVTPFYPPSKGGISNVVNNLCKALECYNNEIYVMTSFNSKQHIVEKKEKNLFRIKSIYLPGWPYSTLRSFSIPFDLGFQVRRIIENGKFDLIHVHGHHYPICWIAIRYAHKQSLPVVLSLHGMYALNPNVLGGRSIIEDIFNRSIFSYVLSKSNVIIGGTNYIKQYAEKYAKPGSEFAVVANGVNTINFRDNLGHKKEYRRTYQISEDKIVILFVGRLEEVKGITEFSQAAKLLTDSNKNFEIIIVGEGNLSRAIKAITHGIENIRVLDWVSPEKIHEIYIASDIFVLSSKFEALPLTIIEAMNANLFIIYTPVGGVEDILKGYSKKIRLSNVTPTDIFNQVLKVSAIHSFSNIDLPSKEYANTFDWKQIAFEINKIYEVLSIKS